MFSPGEAVIQGTNLRVTFVRYLSESQAIIKVGSDTRIVGTADLRKA